MPTIPIRRTVRLIGVPTDINSSFLRGAALGPAAIRKALASDHANGAAEIGDAYGMDAWLNDAGDLPLREEAADDSRIADAVAAAIAAGDMPFCLGGDHAITFPAAAAVAKAHGPLSILHFDAHSDIYENVQGNPRSHASPFARIMEAGIARRLVQVGIRTLNPEQAAQIARFGVEVVRMMDFTPDTVPALDGPLYISFDLDGLDPSVAPGVSHHEPGGLTVREALAVLSRQTANIVGADIVELNPTRDLHDMTATVAAKLVREIAALAARNAD
jgi:agmatinase